MTKEKAIKWLKVEASYIEEDVGHGKEILEAYDMAIKALEQKPCNDAISRQAAIDIIYDNEYKKDMREELETLPPVTPLPKVGEWLEKEVNSDKVIEEWQSARCSVCDRYHTTPYMYYFSHYDYCPHCGCRMEVEE